MAAVLGGTSNLSDGEYVRPSRRPLSWICSLSIGCRAPRRPPGGLYGDRYLLPFSARRGYDVLHPMGWDAFGLPAERYAMQTNIHPRVTTEQNIATFRRQIRMLGLSYDWSREIDTTTRHITGGHSGYSCGCIIRGLTRESSKRGRFRRSRTNSVRTEARGWSAMFLLLRKNGGECPVRSRQDILSRFRLAYVAEIPVNWCEGSVRSWRMKKWRSGRRKGTRSSGARCGNG